MRKYKYSLFDVVGVELEYMVVDRDTMRPRPIVDKILLGPDSKPVNEIYKKNEVCEFAWSNELVAHVLEFKTKEPVKSLNRLDIGFHDQVKLTNNILEKYNAVLMPTGMHPYMQPDKETVLWQHDSFEIYNQFDKIFSCKGHGWSNIQSTHINLPFSTDDEFYKLHTAIRIILPIIPGISASTPVVDGVVNGIHDNRLIYYQDNCKKIPSITGKIVPEYVGSVTEYREEILDKIFAELKPYDEKGLISHDWVNARGAIPNFERGSIEIRVIDIQESVRMDIAIIELVKNSVEALVNGVFSSFEKLCALSTDELYDILHSTMINGSNAVIQNKKYLEVFGIKEKSANVLEVWKKILEVLSSDYDFNYFREILFILNNGSLSSRILKKIKKEPLCDIYYELILCLEENGYFR